MKIRIPQKTSLSERNIADIAFILFFANPSLRTFIAWVFDDNTIVTCLDVFILYTPVFLLVCMNPRKYLKLDFLGLYLFLLTFLGLTILVHPEYEPYFGSKMGTYSLWNYILVPYRGIYSYLFIRLVNDPDRILKNMRISGWLMFLYFFYQILLYFRRGYWVGVGWGNNTDAHLSYSVSFGYEVLLFALTYMYCAFQNKKWIDILSTAACLMMMLAAGSRGPILFVGLFVALYIIMEFQQSRKKTLYFILVITLTIILFLTYRYILAGIALLIEKFGLNSRFITKLLAGEISDDSGRSRLWRLATEMIRKNPLGYGALGCRHVIVPYIIAGYPHSIILEILVEYGVIPGSVILVTLLIGSIRMLFHSRNKAWSGIFLVFFSTACGLFLSLTYWRIPAFWSALAIGVCCAYENRRKKRNTTRTK